MREKIILISDLAGGDLCFVLSLFRINIFVTRQLMFEEN